MFSISYSMFKLTIGFYFLNQDSRFLKYPYMHLWLSCTLTLSTCDNSLAVSSFYLDLCGAQSQAQPSSIVFHLSNPLQSFTKAKGTLVQSKVSFLLYHFNETLEFIAVSFPRSSIFLFQIKKITVGNNQSCIQQCMSDIYRYSSFSNHIWASK